MGAFVNGSSRQIRKLSLWNGFGVDMGLLWLYLFLSKYFFSKAGYNKPMQEWYSPFVDNKG